ncbi:MAG: pyridoxal phosphate-dependent aminotransferase [Planctomycetota bacterium]|nr:pyridoxal phosphate-dependent aminotransferase [Planctomycetota bacterium]
MRIAKRVLNVAPSPTLAVSAQAKAMKAQGIGVVSFGAGEPDFDTPDHIKQAAIDALKAGFTKYPLPVAGIPELREAIAAKLKRENGLDYSPDDIATGIGGKGALFTLFQVLIDPGDEVLIPAPYWVSYPEMARLAEGVPVFVDAGEENDFKLTPEQLDKAITPKTRLVVLNSPGNPTGSVYTPDELAALAGVIVRRNVCVVSDEIYEHLVYEGVEQRSIASFGPEIKRLTVVCNGFAKAYSMTGWRLGYLAGPADIIKAVNKHHSHSTSGPASFVQKAGAAALNGPQDTVETMRVEFDKRRKYMVGRLSSLPGVTCRVPRGAFYAFPSIAGWVGRELAGKRITGSLDFTAVCLEKAHVALVPGIAFGADRYVRLSYAMSMDKIREGLDRIERLLGG